MHIAILTKNPNSYSHQRLVQAGEERGHSMHLINMSYCYMNISATSPEVYYRSSEIFKNIDAIIPRIDPMNTSYGTAVLRQFELMHVYSLNSANAINNSRDKLRALQLMAKKQISMPITGFADSPEDAEKLIDLVGGAPLIVKLLDGTQGRGTVFAETPQAAVSVINAFKQLKANILVQECIEETSGQDIRCIVIGQKVVASIQRTPKEGGILKNHLSPNNASPIKLTSAERKMASHAAKAMKLNVASVDLIRSSKGPLVLDIDPSPSLELIEKTTHLDIASSMIEFIEEEYKN
ncbi:MAG: alpha-L-glutamate ligase, RimK family [Francisellaceae bacterium]|nr:alpha-L-glutamate ligase, RimK family [Francisellaceae bacterium]